MKTLFYNARLVDAYSDNDGAILIEDGFITNVFMGFLLPSIFKKFLHEKRSNRRGWSVGRRISGHP